MKLLKNIIITLCVLSLLLLAFVACEAEESLRLEADKTTAKHGEVVTLNAVHVTKKGEAPAENVTYELTAGAEIATLENNKLTVSTTAKHGDTITVVAKSGELTSGAVTVTVHIPTNSLSIQASKQTAKREEIVSIAINLTENGQSVGTDDVELTVTKGADAATLVGTQLTIKADAAHGTVIELVATYKEMTSNAVTVTVDVPVSSITAASSASSILPGGHATLQYTLAPAGAAGTVEWTVTEGADHAVIAGNALLVNSGVPFGTQIKVQAKCGEIVSNVLTFTVGDANSAEYYINLSNSTLTVDRNGTSDAVLSADVYNYHMQPVTDKALRFEVIEGAELLALNANGNICTFTALGHGNAVVRVSVEGTNTAETVAVKVIVPPDAVKLPEVFAERQGFVYNVSMINPGTNLADRIPFAASVLGTNVCTTLKYTFAHEDGTTGNEVATWGDGKITFLKTGRVTVTVSSDSGSRNETVATYTFNVNRGYNVRNYTELKTLLESAGYHGETVNVVVTDKPVGATSYAYGYDLVPPTALKPAAEQTWQEVMWGTQISVHNKNVHINGNNHKIDASELRVIPKSELDALNAQGGGLSVISALIEIQPNVADPAQIAGRQYSAKIFDLGFVGNVPVDFPAENLNGYRPWGGINTGLVIGSADYQVVYHVEVSGITASRFNVGIRFRHAVGDATVDNLNVYNCFSNGIETEASILTFGNLTFGKCGAAGMEMVPSNSTAAGDTLNQNQRITFQGVIDTTQNLNNGQTVYFNNYNLSGVTVPQVLLGVLAPYQDKPTTLSHMMNEKGEFAFVTFIFHDFSTQTPNQSEVNYPGYQTGGIIKAQDLPTDGSIDTTHEYILLEVKLADYGLDLGYALLYNHNYVAD